MPAADRSAPNEGRVRPATDRSPASASPAQGADAFAAGRDAVVSGPRLVREGGRRVEPDAAAPRRAANPVATHRLCLVHPIDPRRLDGDPIGRRLAVILAARPADFSLLVVGVDDRGDLVPGERVSLDLGGHRVDFLPVARAGGRRFAAGLLRHAAAVRAAAGTGFRSVSVHDVAWVPLARLLGRPLVLVVHRDPRRDRPGRGGAVAEALALHLADRIVGLDEAFVRRCRETDPVVAARIEALAIDDGSTSAALFGREARIARLWERHRRFWDAREVLHHGAAAA